MKIQEKQAMSCSKLSYTIATQLGLTWAFDSGFFFVVALKNVQNSFESHKISGNIFKLFRMIHYLYF